MYKVEVSLHKQSTTLQNSGNYIANSNVHGTRVQYITGFQVHTFQRKCNVSASKCKHKKQTIYINGGTKRLQLLCINLQRKLF